LLWLMLGRLKSALRRWSAEARFWPFVLISGILCFGGSIAVVMFVFNSIQHGSAVAIEHAPRYLALGVLGGPLWGALTWLLTQRHRRC
jgi:hypothetical protein